MSVAHVVLVLIAVGCLLLTVMVAVLFWSSIKHPTPPPPFVAAQDWEEPFNVSVWVPPSEWDVFEEIMAGMPDVEDTYNTILQEQP